MGKRVKYGELGNWDVNLNKNDDGSASHNDLVVAVLFVIRDELRVISRKLNALECGNFIAIPRTLKAIQRNTTKKKRPAGKPKLRVVA
jgi:hypothetical protein